jgi:hypothetical protein
VRIGGTNEEKIYLIGRRDIIFNYMERIIGLGSVRFALKQSQKNIFRGF